MLRKRNCRKRFITFYPDFSDNVVGRQIVNCDLVHDVYMDMLDEKRIHITYEVKDKEIHSVIEKFDNVCECYRRFKEIKSILD